MTEAFQLSSAPQAPDAFEKVITAWEEVCERPRAVLSVIDLDAPERARCGIAIRVLREELRLEPEIISARLGIPTTHVRLLTIESNRLLAGNTPPALLLKSKHVSLRNRYREDVAAAEKILKEQRAEAIRQFEERARHEREKAAKEAAARAEALEKERDKRRLALRDQRSRIHRTFSQLRLIYLATLRKRRVVLMRLSVSLSMLKAREKGRCVPKRYVGVDPTSGALLIHRVAYCFWVHPANILGPHRSFTRDVVAARRCAMVFMLRQLYPSAREIGVAEFFGMGTRDVRVAIDFVDALLRERNSSEFKLSLENLCAMYEVSPLTLRSRITRKVVLR